MTSRSIVLASLLAALVACSADATPEPPGPGPAASAEPPADPPAEPETPSTLWSTTPSTDCGDVTYGNGANACPADRETKFDCFLAAKTACNSARIGIQYTSDEGHPTFEEMRIDSACNVAVSTDTTKDAWSANPGVSSRTCATVSRTPTESCSLLLPGGCS